MNELLPYEEQLAGKLADIPLPDENPAWDAMRKMLDDDDDGIVPPPVNSGCRRWGLGLLLLLLLVSVTWGVYKFWGKNGENGTPEKTLPVKEMPAAAKDSSTAAGQTHAKRVDPDSVTAGKGVNADIKSSDNKKAPPVVLNKQEAVSAALASRFRIKSSRPATIFDAGNPTNKKGVFAVKTKGNELRDTGMLLQKVTETALKPVIGDNLRGVVANGKQVKDAGKNGREIITNTPTADGVKAPSATLRTNKDTVALLKPKSLPVKKN